MATYHTVKQGEYLLGIASRYGFTDYQTIYNHPKNADFKKKRPNPNVLYPGDRIFIPDKQEKQESRATAQVHRFTRPRQTVLLRLKVQDLLGQPLPAGSRCRLKVESQDYSPTIGADGLIEQEIPLTAENGRLLVSLQETGADGAVTTRELPFTLKIGHLDPVEEDSGTRARLNNMGYMAGFSRTDQKQLKWAVEEFQCENDVRPVNGRSDDPPTQAKLKEVHGC